MTHDATPSRASAPATGLYCRGCGKPLELAPRTGGSATTPPVTPPAAPPTTPPTTPPPDAHACAHCGKTFDPHAPHTFDRVGPRRRRRDLVVGLACAVVLAGAAVGAAVGLAQMRLTSFESAFGAHLAAGLAIGVVASVLAGRNQSRVATSLLLVASTLAIWIGLFMALDDGYRAWQRMPEPPDEAFNDGAAPIAALVLGWIPGALVTAIVFVAAWLVSRDREAAPPTATTG